MKNNAKHMTYEQAEEQEIWDKVEFAILNGLDALVECYVKGGKR